MKNSSFIFFVKCSLEWQVRKLLLKKDIQNHYYFIA